MQNPHPTQVCLVDKLIISDLQGSQIPPWTVTQLGLSLVKAIESIRADSY
jgi:hypothetical protein